MHFSTTSTSSFFSSRITPAFLINDLPSHGCSPSSFPQFHRPSSDRRQIARPSLNCGYVTVRCRKSSEEPPDGDGEDLTTTMMKNGEWLARATPYQILGLEQSFSFDELKSAFRSRVKQFHPDVSKDPDVSQAIMLRVIEAYEALSTQYTEERILRSDCMDPFEEPECEAIDLFVNEVDCIGQGCPYSCVKQAPHVFRFDPLTGAARVVSQGHGGNSIVQLTVGQCPRKCIHYVTPMQRAILEDILNSIVGSVDIFAEAASLHSLLTRAKFENNRFQTPKPRSKASDRFVDWM